MWLFEVGDKVKVTMTSDDIFNFQYGPTFMATIEHMPNGVGDCFHLRVSSKVILLNPLSSVFVGMEKEKV